MSKDITAERIREKRLELGLTQAVLAEMSGYSGKSSINKIEKESRGMPMDKLLVIAKSLKCSPAYLMGWDDETIGKEIDRQNQRHETLSEIQRLFDLLTPEQQKVITDLIRSFVEANK